MADERDAWLDKDAAERLLRGEPVEAMDKDVLAGSERLARALRDIAAIAYANDTELPGEAAALAAFRRAGAAGDGSAADPGTGESVLVRLALAPRAVSRSQTGRPVRRGFAVAVASCALGGIAVAAGAGVMPPLFAGEEDPVPANSISAVATPRPFVSGSPADARGTGVPSGGPSADGREQPVPHLSSEDGAGGADGAEGTRDHAAHSGQGGQGGAERSFTAASGDRAAAFYRKTLDACRDLRSGTIDQERRQALETLAEGRQEAELFCAGLLDGRDGRDGDGNKGGPGGNEGDGHGDGSIRNGDADGGGGKGSDGPGGGGDWGNGNGDGNGGGNDGGNGDGSPEGPTLGDPSPHTSPSPTPTPDAPPVPSETPRNPHQDPAPNPHPGSTESLPIPF